MLGIDLGSTLVKVCAICADGSFKTHHFRSTKENIEHYFGGEGEDTIKGLLPEGIKKWCCVGAGSVMNRSFLSKLNSAPSFGDEMVANAFYVASILKDNTKYKIHGGTGKIGDKYIIASMGTGVSFVLSSPNADMKHIGGSALGGGTLMGLSRLILNVNNFKDLCDLARRGDSTKVDLLISDIFGENYGSILTADVVASSMAKASFLEERPTDEDIAASLIATASFSIGSHLAALCDSKQANTAIFIGGFLDTDEYISRCLVRAVNLFQPNITCVIPNTHQYGGAIGAALSIQ